MSTTTKEFKDLGRQIEQLGEDIETNAAYAKDLNNFVYGSKLRSLGRETIRNANTTDSDLATKTRSRFAIDYLGEKLAPLGAFTVQFETNPLMPKSTVQVEVVTAAGAAQTNATNREDTTNFVVTNVAVPVAVDAITSGGHFTNAETNSGFVLDRCLRPKLDEFASKIMDVVMAPITVANFGAAVYTGPASAFGRSDLGALWQLIANADTKTFLADKDFYAQFLPGELSSAPSNLGMPGWDNFLCTTAGWDSAGLDVAAIACAPEAIAVAAGLPAVSPRAKQVANFSTITIPGIGLQVLYSEWHSNASRTVWFNLDVVIGAAKAIGSALKIVKRQS